MEHCINTRRPLPPVAWVVDSAPVRTVFCNLPPQKTKTIMQSTISLGSCPACRKLRGNVTTTNPNPSDNWWFDIAMSILSSENEDCHEDRGPNPLDPCDCCRRQRWEGGPGGDTMQGGGRGGGVAARDLCVCCALDPPPGPHPLPAVPPNPERTHASQRGGDGE